MRIGIDVSDEVKLIDALYKTFPRRYLPSFGIIRSDIECCNDLDAYIKWQLSNKFLVNELSISDKIDMYIISSPIPQPYIAEEPVFFLLQVIARALAKKGYIVMTDAISLYVGNKAILFIGYPHTGKSTISAIALARGYIPLSTENTIIEVDESAARIISGSSVLVYDPRIEEIYGINLKYDELTKHGYRVIDLDKHYPERTSILERRPVIDSIYLLHCSYNSVGFSYEEVKGRKIKKLLWHFSSALVRGLDYYNPYPLSLSDHVVDTKLSTSLDRLAAIYTGKFYEVYGKHDNVLDAVIRKIGSVEDHHDISTCN